MTHLEIRAELDTDINPKLSIRSEFDELQNRSGNFFFFLEDACSMNEYKTLTQNAT